MLLGKRGCLPLRIVAATLWAASLYGCATTARTHSAMMNEYMFSETEFQRGVGQLDDRVYSGDRQIRDRASTVSLLELGAIYGAVGKLEESNQILERVFWRYVAKEEGPVISLRSTGHGLLSYTMTTGTGPYLPAVYERIYLHAIKARNFLLLNDVEAARVEVRRAYNIQRALREELERKRRQVKEEDRQRRLRDPDYGRAAGGIDVGAIHDRLDPDPALRRKLAAISSPYENAYAMMLAATVYLLEGEIDDALIEARRAAEVSGSSQASKVAGALENAQEGQGSQTVPNVLVFAEINSAPRKYSEDIRFINYSTGTMMKISFPVYRPVDRTVDRVQVDGESLDPITDVELLAFKDFEEELPVLIAQTITRAVSHALKDDYLEEELGPLGSLLGTLTNELMEGADTRSWTMLPGKVLFGALHASVPEVVLEIERAGAPIRRVLEIDPEGINLIHVVANARLSEIQQGSFDMPKLKY